MSLACGQVLRQVCATSQAPSLVDLGCGDLGLLAPLLQTLPLGHYTGLDLCAEVLPLAQAALRQAPFPQSWLAEDLLSWANAPQAQAVEVIHSSFAVHHLQQDGICWPGLTATGAGRSADDLAAAHRRAARLVAGGHGAIEPDAWGAWPGAAPPD